MASVKYDVSDVESGGGGEEPQPATYPGRIVSMTNRKKLADGKTPVSDLEIVCDIGKEFVRLWTYVKLPDDPNWNKEAHGWKLRELTDALGLPPKGSIDIAKINKEKPPVLVKVTADSHRDTGDYRGKIKNLFPAKAGEEPAPADDDSDPGQGNDEGPYDREEIESWSDDDIKGYADELGAEGPTSGRGWKTKLIDAIIEAQDAASGETPDDAEPDGGSGADLSGLDPDVATEVEKILNGESVDDWDDDDVKWLVEGLGIDGNVKTAGRGWQAKAKSAVTEYIAETYGGADPGDDDGGEAEVEDDMDDVDDAGNPVWSDQDLKDEIASRNEQGAEIKISGRWTRAKAIEALREDNKNAEPF